MFKIVLLETSDFYEYELKILLLLDYLLANLSYLTFFGNFFLMIVKQ